MKRNGLVPLALLLMLGLWLTACAPEEAANTELPPTAVPSPSQQPSATRTEVPTPAPTATPACQRTEGELVEASYLSAQLNRQVPLWVYLPPCYPRPGEQLPAAFFFHGKPFDQSHWEDIGLIETYQNGLAQGRWQRALLVLPNLPEPLFSRSDGGPGSYEQEFMESVIPAVETEYAVASQNYQLAGISRGGIWALEIGLRHPDHFGRVAALSPSLAVNYPRPGYDPFQLALTAESYPRDMLLLAGEQDWARPDTERLAADLIEAGARLELKIVPGEHQDQTWEASLPQVLDFLLPPGS